MCEYMVNETHTHNKICMATKNIKSYLREKREENRIEEGYVRASKFSNVSPQRRERGREANVAPNTRFIKVGQQELYTFCMLEPFHN